jgi:hypothetical protein
MNARKWRNVMRMFRWPAIIVLALISLPAARTQASNEIMTDRCSNLVAFPPTYDGKPNANGTVILSRGTNGWSAWSAPFKVSTGDSGHVRWWCHSTIGNVFDLGTITASFDPGGIVGCVGAIGTTVVTEGSGAASLAACTRLIKFGSSAWKGWTPERSRCGNHSTRLRARLGPDRLLQTECLGN